MFTVNSNMLTVNSNMFTVNSNMFCKPILYSISLLGWTYFESWISLLGSCRVFMDTIDIIVEYKIAVGITNVVGMR